MATLLANTPAEPAVLFSEEIEDLLLEARNYLDGEPIANEQQAEAVSSILNRARRIEKDADMARAAEKKPHDDAGKAVQAKWKPILSKAELAANTAKQALAPWLRKVEEDQRRAAEAARVEAQRLAEEAAAKHRVATGDFAAQEQAEQLLKDAQRAEREAAKADKAKPLARGGERAVGLVDKFTPELVDPVEALRHYRTAQPESLKAWLLDQARKDVTAGIRSIPGFTIHHERVAR
jgi:hypothetical protein